MAIRILRNFTKRLFNLFFKRKKQISLGFYGPPNSGKTTLANRICKDWTGEDIGTVSNIPHETRHVQFKEEVEIKYKEKSLKFKLVDTPGIATKIDYEEFIHFGLTSQDINNTAVPYSIKDALNYVYYPEMEEVLKALTHMVDEWRDVSMLAKTHGQPASPTRLGKEIMVFANRMNQQLSVLKQIPNSAKFGGATGNFNAHAVAYPAISWKDFGNKFLSEKLGLEREQWTTQISNYDIMASQFDAMKRINTILIDFCRDIWTYVSMEYFKQRIKEGEVGSSAMPHKVNPIDFENAEGNLAIANASFEFLSGKLPISRLQRDLTDSTVLRNVGVPFAHTIIATQSILKGLSKLLLNETAIYRDLDNTWAVVAEGIQTILRREAYPSPYEALKALTRTNEGINEKSIRDFIETLDVSQSVKEELRRITPRNYTGV